jgi:hypothetical protein
MRAAQRRAGRDGKMPWIATAARVLALLVLAASAYGMIDR